MHMHLLMLGCMRSQTTAHLLNNMSAHKCIHIQKAIALDGEEDEDEGMSTGAVLGITLGLSVIVLLPLIFIVRQ